MYTGVPRVCSGKVNEPITITYTWYRGGIVSPSRRVSFSNSPRLSSVSQGDLVFDGAAVFSNNEASTTENTNLGRGGAIYNARIGTITFNGPLTATENNADVRTSAMYAVNNRTPLVTSTTMCCDSPSRVGEGTPMASQRNRWFSCAVRTSVELGMSLSLVMCVSVYQNPTSVCKY